MSNGAYFILILKNPVLKIKQNIPFYIKLYIVLMDGF